MMEDKFIVRIFETTKATFYCVEHRKLFVELLSRGLPYYRYWHSTEYKRR
jgi:hypothetical protein